MSDIIESIQFFLLLGTVLKNQDPLKIQLLTLKKSIFTKCDIKKGDVISLENITIKGPGHGLLPKFLPLILGKKINNMVKKDHPITWDDLLTQ